MKRLLSIIVPVYGEAEYLDACVSSIAGQTYENLEIILVDDGSPDECPALCDKWAQKDSRIKVIHKENGGLVSARKAGMCASVGEYIGYVDGDDWIDPDYYEVLVSNMEQNRVDMVVCGYRKELMGKSIVCDNPLQPGIYGRKSLEQDVFPNMIFDSKISTGSICTYVWNKLFKRELVFEHQMRVDNDIVVGEDAMCVYPAILESDSIAVIDYAGYHYRQRIGSLLRSMGNNPKGIERMYRFYKQFSNEISAKAEKWQLLIQLEQYYLCQIIMMCDSLQAIYPNIPPQFPFFDVMKGERVIIYSAGAFGLHLVNLYRNTNYVQIVAWTDPDYSQYKDSDYGIVAIREALKGNYDKVIIASTDYRYIATVKNELAELGVDRGKITSCDKFKDEIRDAVVSVGLLHG